MSYTNRARLYLVFSPILMLIVLVLDLGMAIDRAGREFWEVLSSVVRDDIRWLYRDVYRVARYGSVHDVL